METPRRKGPHQELEPGGTPEADAETPSAREAAEQLRSYDAVRERSQERRPPRALILLELWTAIMITAYIATALTTVGRFDSPYHLLLAIGLMTLLSTGARERFAVRKRPMLRTRVVAWVAVLVFLALGLLRIRDIPYPWWIDALVLLAVFCALAAGPFRQWLLPASRTEHTAPAPLAGPARLNTVLVAALLGFLMTTVVWQYGWMVAIAFPLLGLVELPRLNGPWGLRRTGHDWAPVHWAAFGAGVLLLFALVLLSLSTSLVTALLCITVGSVFTVAMAATALLPRRTSRPAG